MTDDIERAARAIASVRIRENRRWDTPPDKLEAMLLKSVDIVWRDFAHLAQAVRDADRDAGKVLVDAAMIDGLREEIRLLSEQLSAANDALLARDLPK